LFLEKLDLKNFKNYNYLCMNFDSLMNVFVGENAQGKTNLLESIYLLATGTCPRVYKDEELVKHGEDFFMVRGTIQKQTDTYRVVVNYSKGREKAVLINDKRQRRFSDLIGIVNVVYFSPDSLGLVKGVPASRRAFLDFDLCQTNVLYKDTLLKYRKVIKQRNALLKELKEKRGASAGAVLDVWNKQTAEFGAYIIACRMEMIDSFNKLAAEIHKTISDGKEDLSLKYSSCIDMEGKSQSEIEALLYGKLRSHQQVEIMRGITLVGPHRDDVIFMVDNLDLKIYGSQGQQRTAVLACKIAELELIKEKVNEYPLLLLDDVMSELDEIRRLKLLSILQKKVQTFITTTNLDNLDKSAIKEVKLFRVTNGCVRCEQ
jgi:DNA replication and repair protein RecF